MSSLARLLADKKPAKVKTPRCTKKNTDEIVKLGPLSDAIRQYAKETRGSTSNTSKVSTTIAGFDAATLDVLFSIAHNGKVPDTAPAALIRELADVDLIVNHFPYDGTKFGIPVKGRKMIADFTKTIVTRSLKLL